MTFDSAIEGCGRMVNGYALRLERVADGDRELRLSRNNVLRITDLGNGSCRLSGSERAIDAITQVYQALRTGSGIVVIYENLASRLEACCRSFYRENREEKLAVNKESFKTQLDELKKRGKSEAEAIVKRRVGQDVLRKRLLATRGKCEISGIDIPELLVASHIKEWAESTDDEKFDEENVLLIACNWDALFDKHFISFDPETGKMVKSDRISEVALLSMGVPSDWQETVGIGKPSPKRAEYLRWHNNKCLS